MATYLEINDLLKVTEDSGLRQRVAVATMVKADAMRSETDDATQAVRERKRFSKQIFNQSLASVSDSIQASMNNAPLAFSPMFEAVYRLVLIANKSATVAQITGASDSVVQSAVNDAVDHLAASYNDPVVI